MSDSILFNRLLHEPTFNELSLVKEDSAKLVAKCNKQYIKIFKKNSYLEKIKVLFIGNCAVRSIKGSELLLNGGLNAPKITNSGSIQNYPYILMEHIQGMDIASIIYSFAGRNNKTQLSFK